MNIHDIQAQIDDLRAKLASATGDEKERIQAEIDKLTQELKSTGENIKEVL